MRIAVCGPNKKGAIAKAEEVLHVSAVKSWGNTIIDQAAETYKHFEESNVIFDGSAFDFLTDDLQEGYYDVNEQIALNTIQNLDYIVVISMGMDKNLLKTYQEYAKIFPGKILIYSSEIEFEIIVK